MIAPSLKREDTRAFREEIISRYSARCFIDCRYRRVIDELYMSLVIW